MPKELLRGYRAPEPSAALVMLARGQHIVLHHHDKWAAIRPQKVSFMPTPEISKAHEPCHPACTENPATQGSRALIQIVGNTVNTVRASKKSKKTTSSPAKGQAKGSTQVKKSAAKGKQPAIKTTQPNLQSSITSFTSDAKKDSRTANAGPSSTGLSDLPPPSNQEGSSSQYPVNLTDEVDAVIPAIVMTGSNTAVGESSQTLPNANTSSSGPAPAPSADQGQVSKRQLVTVSTASSDIDLLSDSFEQSMSCYKTYSRKGIKNRIRELEAKLSKSQHNVIAAKNETIMTMDATIMAKEATIVAKDETIGAFQKTVASLEAHNRTHQEYSSRLLDRSNDTWNRSYSSPFSRRPWYSAPQMSSPPFSSSSYEPGYTTGRVSLLDSDDSDGHDRKRKTLQDDDSNAIARAAKRHRNTDPVAGPSVNKRTTV